MVRLVIYLVSLVAIAMGLSWLADRPGTLHVVWQGLNIDTTVFKAVVLLAALIATAIFIWSIGRAVWNSPAALGERIVRRRQKRGLEALSSGLIAVGSGDKALAQRYALQARKSLPHEPLTHLLRAQAAHLSGDRATTRRIYEAMLASPETEQLGLRGLYLEAHREGAGEAARQFAERALKTNPKLGWPADGLFDLQCRNKDWAGALETLGHGKRHGHFEKSPADRKRAVLLTAQAQDLEENEAEKALQLAQDAHALAPDLVPAAVVAGRILASRGNTSKAAKLIQKTWAKAPHPELATVYAYARIGDSPRDRLDRIRQLAALNPHSIESPIAIATTAIDARLYDEARAALEPLLTTRLTQRVASLMARIEAGENGDKGRVREWLARAVHAARDPAWTADGIVSEHWQAVSPVTGTLDAFQWRVPVESLEKSGPDLVAERLEELLAISATPVGGSATQPAAAAEPASKVHPGHVRAAAVDAEPVTITAKATAPMSQTPKTVQAAEPAPAPVAAAAARQPEPAKVAAEPVKPETAAVAKPVAKPVDAKPPVELATRKPVAAKPVAAEPAAAKAMVPASKAAQARPDPKIFVPPHAPDDPGPEAAESEAEPVAVKKTFRVAN
jgi:HemY protein